MSLRIAIVGCGKIAEQHVAAIKRISGTELVAACDREGLMAEQLAERHAIRHASDDLAALLRDARPDVVHITTPPASHYALACQCVDAGCHVYVEKPFTLDTAEAERVYAQAERRGVQVIAGHNAQFNWENVEARKLIANGFLGGPPVYIESYYTYSLGDARYAKALLGDKNHWVRRLPGKLLHNIISHGIARIAEFMTADRPDVRAFGYPSPLLQSIGEHDVVDELRVHIADGNTTATFVFSSQLRPAINGYRAYGALNSLEVDNVHHTVTRRRARGYKSYVNYVLTPVQQARESLRSARQNVGRFLRAEFHDDSGMKALIHGFYDAIRSGGPLPVTKAEVLRTSRIMDVIFEQLQAQQRPAAAPSRIEEPAFR